MPMPDRIRDMIRRHIDGYGQHVWQIFISEGDTPDSLPFVYTIGNHEWGLPELLLIGSNEDWAADLLNALGKKQRTRRSAFQHGELVDLGGTFPVRVIDTSAVGREEYAVQAGVYYGTDEFKVSQVLLCDRAGRFPDDPACDPFYRSRQPILAPS